jgi:hypothetical protein
VPWLYGGRVPGGPYLAGGIFVDAIMVLFIYNIWMGRSWARDVYAAIVGVGLVSGIVFAGPARIDILHALLKLGALYLLFRPPGRDWFKAESPVP